MPAIGVLEILSIMCAVHIIRTGRPYYWLYIIFIPVVGVAAYVIAEILPEFLQTRGARQVTAGIAKALNPGKSLREAQQRVQITPTAENKARLAQAYLGANQPAEAAALYREALAGIHATDPGMMLGLARALFAEGDVAETRAVLERLREANPELNSPEGHLLYARALEQQDKTEEALSEYAALSAYYPGQEARCRYALLLRRVGRESDAKRIFEEVCQLLDYGPRHQRRLQREWHDVAKRALAAS
ncbi:MAG TPA: tetratricopeptide repeat protein [Stellaceae bacterium]|nr:tetratricopeptide repeat protein [Stellaceae bacterium]